MAHGTQARKRRLQRRAKARARGVQNAQVDLVASLEARKEARAGRTVLELVPEPVSQLEARRQARFAASGSAGLPLGPRDATWDSSAADKAVRAWAGVTDKPNAKYAQAFLYKDTSDGGADAFGDYKLPFASPVDGKLTANWGGITSAAGALQGARGGVQIPDADKAAIKSKIEGYYKKAATAYKDKSIKVPWADGANAAHELAYAELGPDADPAVLAVTELAWEEAFAATMPACANCEDAYADHLGTEGPCTVEGCDCSSYEEPDIIDADGDGDLSNGPTKAGIAASLAWQIEHPGETLPPPPHIAALMSRKALRQAAGIPFEPADELLLALRVVESVKTGEAAEYVRMRLTNFAVVADDPVVGMLPDAHKPGARLPKKNPAPKITPVATAAPAGPMQWSAIFAPEGKLTSDGRAFAPGSITWRELPLTLMAMVETSEGGHIGAEVAGRIDKIWRDDTAGLIRASGVFDSGEYGQQIAALVDDQTLRGVSVDLAIQEYDTGPKSDWFDADGNWDPKPAAPDDTPDLLKLYSEDIIAVVLSAEIGMSTVCPFPAFAEAKIAMGESLVAGGNPAFWTVTQEAGFLLAKGTGDDLTASADPDGLTAAAPCVDCGEVLTAAAEGLVPVAPPASWFDNPNLTELTPLTVTDDGRVFGHPFGWETCHIGLPGQCRTAPHSHTDYKLFHLGEIVCDDGSRVACGQITLDSPHADHGLDVASTTRHYDHTGTVVAHVRMGEDQFGGWVAGSLQPDAPAEKVRLMRGSKLSGDWRKYDGNLELCALLCVNVPGFPIPRAHARLVASALAGGEMEVLSLVAAGIPIFEEDVTAEEWEQFAVLRAHAQFAQLRAQG